MGLCVCICVCFTWCINAGMITIFVIFNFHPFSICFEIQREKQFLTDKGQRPHHRHQGQFFHFSSILGDFFFFNNSKRTAEIIFCNNTDLGVLPPTFSSLSHYHLSSIPLENLPSNFCAVFLINPHPSAFCHFKLKIDEK